MVANRTTLAAYLKEYYLDKQDLTQSAGPFYNLVKKATDFSGDFLALPVAVAPNTAASTTFSNAQNRSASTASSNRKWQISHTTEYGVARVDGVSQVTMKPAAYLDALTHEIDSTKKWMMRRIALKMFGSGYGTLGQIGSISTNTITLANVEDIINFEVGGELVLAAAEASGATRALGTSGNGLIITNVNADTGVLTFAANVTDATDGIPTAAASDFIFYRGDRDSSSPVITLAGLGAWCPTSVTATPFFNVDRSINPTRLAGHRITQGATPILEVLMDAGHKIFRHGGEIDTFFMAPRRVAELEKSLQSQVRYTDYKVNQELSFRGLDLQTPVGPVKIFSEPNCSDSTSFGVKLNDWVLHTAGGKTIGFTDEDGADMLRVNDADQVEVRLRMVGQLYTKNTANMIRINH